ncbi:MAG: DUF3784 domain-containing protein [Spirochaetales bacterium]|nr:DUF3784 domain-containing protein [Spirochaetales bacterium]
MVLLISGMVCAFIALIAAVILQFRLGGWLWLSGLSAMDSERRARCNSEPLRRRLSILLYVLSFIFLFAAFFLHIRLISPLWYLRLLFISLIIAIDCIWFVYRRYDGVSHTHAETRAARLFLVMVHAFFGGFYLFLLY